MSHPATRVTRFAARDEGIAVRMAGFVGHLRENGFKLGVAEAGTALEALTHVACPDPTATRRALKAVCSGSTDEAKRFDELFDSFWMDAGRVRSRLAENDNGTPKDNTRSTREGDDAAGGAKGEAHAPDDEGEGDAFSDGVGKLVATRTRNLMATDLRKIVSPQDIRAAEAVAVRIGRALRDKRSRRAKIAKRGARIDLRRTARHSLSTGGEPLRLARRSRPDRPVRIAALCDVSGSMTLYARYFLAFLAGLMRADANADAYLFHTRLVRISDALRDEDPLRAINRITLLANGFGGGTRIGGNLDQFARTYARRLVDARTVVVILSDGYDSEGPEVIDAALARLKRRGCRVVWLNPLKGWAGYEPVARGMAAALPHLDLFASATTLADIAALEHELARL